jgi:flagellar hook assembly protein FlgD
MGVFAALIGAMVAITSTTGCKKKAVDAFPATGAVAGWDKVGETRVYAAKDLYQYIDGDAEQYISAGVVSTSTSDYKYKGQLEATLDVHTMGSADGARKILETGTKDAKSIQLGDAGVAYAQSIIFRKGTSLVRIVAYESTPDTPQALLALARGVEAKL